MLAVSLSSTIFPRVLDETVLQIASWDVSIDAWKPKYGIICDLFPEILLLLLVDCANLFDRCMR